MCSQASMFSILQTELNERAFRNGFAAPSLSRRFAVSVRFSGQCREPELDHRERITPLSLFNNGAINAVFRAQNLNLEAHPGMKIAGSKPINAAFSIEFSPPD